MKISDCVLKNENLSSEMQLFLKEITRLYQIRDSLRDNNKSGIVNLEFIQGINRVLRKVRARFDMINEDYEDEYKISTEISESMISYILTEIKEGMEDISDLMMRFTIKEKTR